MRKAHLMTQRLQWEREANRDDKYPQASKPSMPSKKFGKHQKPPDDPASQTPTPSTVLRSNVVGGTSRRNSAETPKTVLILIDGGHRSMYELRDLIYSDDEGGDTIVDSSSEAEDHGSSSQDEMSDSEDVRDLENSNNGSRGVDEETEPDFEMVDATPAKPAHCHVPSRNHWHKQSPRQGPCQDRLTLHGTPSWPSRPSYTPPSSLLPSGHPITDPAPTSVCSMTPSDSISHIHSDARAPLPEKDDGLVAIRAELRAKTLLEIYQAIDEVAEKIIGLTIRRIKVRASMAGPDLPEDLYLQKRKWVAVAGVIKEVLEEKTGPHDDALLGGKWWWWMFI
ncbi:uncharacterized protein NECHADRAFT_87141 [Fusarium vanettenii 77-13-4]|uniref:Uncharacterized protein n=1 Tax=Fusarium vanettenii (strain ATCC MYA-4622 / CBS 123669 / FGSC 9596 / NRRL 45880 / 77-13-4) TaxID=660122 RepID=C7ZIH2_FUSV7|nr:uncharacterized protein NECHADRAFT_87141 [Fusarium vanettenii 77-13-4]EEU36263.1 predicted protein [Fusarium vanettenii 77-13-4]